MGLKNKQKKFLKTIENPKQREQQRIQFKLQNKFDEKSDYLIFTDGVCKVPNTKFNQWYLNKKIEAEEKFNQLCDGHIPKGDSLEEEQNSLTKEEIFDLTNPSMFFPEIIDKIKMRRKEQEIISKSNVNSIPPEFCVKITEENKDVLQEIWSNFHKNIVRNLNVGSFLFSNSLFTFCFQSNEEFKKSKIVSTEEFLIYIGKEELIKDYQFFKECTNISKMYSPKLLEKLVEFSEKARKQKPLEFDLPKKENPIQDIECLSINDVLKSSVLIVESPLCKNLKNYLIDIVEKKTNPLNLK